MDIYFYLSFMILIFFITKLWKSANKKDYLLLHTVLKILIVTGVFCIVLIDPVALTKILR
jgi:hypothetical protein